ncbi:MAG: site-specific recombinase [Mucilaginibacter sp.]|nr:site-specific recombinase [Mucilaginibacter sp.]
MKTADLYIRVSTDEQADKGYSQRNQEEVLLRYCNINNITVRKVIFEDHSAKSFIRPEWQKLLSFLKKNKNKSDLILFTKWDRFSRNAPDAYQMIATLKSLGIEPQAIEQPLDMSVPENKMMLAIYLTAPEIENDRRALNVFFGMRRARKEGRYMATAPIGYVNKTLEGGKKTIVINEPQAEIIRWVFNEISVDSSPVIDVWRAAKAKGLNCCRSNFWYTIKNPVYIGKIVIPKLKDEESYTVDGLHEPIISNTIFYEVQDILKGRKRPVKTKNVSNEVLSLKGFINCPICNKLLTGSASKGRNAYYHYYHCVSPCSYRLKAEIVNDEFSSFLKEFELNPQTAELFKLVVLDVFENDSLSSRNIKRQYIDQITSLNNKITKARELLLEGDLEPGDYKTIKSDSENKIAVLEAKVADIQYDYMGIHEVKNLIDNAIGKLCKLDIMYNKSSLYERRKIIGSIFRENITFDNLKLRTAKLNDTFSLIYLINKRLEGKKKGQQAKNSLLSNWVIPSGFEPETYRLEICCSIQLSYRTIMQK